MWNKTNLFVEEFKKENPSRVFDFNFNKLNIETVNSLLSFLEIQIPESNIKKVLNKKTNAQKKGSFAEFENWDENQKLELRNICKELALKYDYKI